MSLIKKNVLKWTLLLSPTLIQAVSVPHTPPAGVVERQIEQEYEAKHVEPEKEIPILEVDIPEEQLDLGSHTVFIEEVSFSGNTILSESELKKLVHGFLTKDLSMKELQELCMKIQAKYAKEGYFLTRAYIPAQEIKNGKIEIVVIEGKLGEVNVIGNKYYSEAFIRRYFTKYQGKPINYDQILKALLLLDENMDLDVGTVFKKGKKFGTADVIVRVKDKRPIHLTIDNNNYGGDHTSKHRTGARFEWGNVLRYGDILTVIEVVGSPMTGLNFTDLIYHFPINTYGSSFDLSYLTAYFKTDKMGEDEIKFVGRSHIATAKFMQALHRKRQLNTDIFTHFDYKQIQNFSKGKRSSYDKLRVLTGGINIDYIDGWNGRNLFTSYFGWGIPNILGGLDAEDTEGSRKDAGGRFFRINGSAKRLQKLPWDCFLLLNGVGQYSFDKLPLPEQIFIGGVETVRGYKLAEALGDSGFYANVELRVPLPYLRDHKMPWSKKKWSEALQLVGFIDHGQVYTIGADKIYENEKINHKKKRTAVPVVGRAVLTSAGVGIRIYGPWKLEFSFDAGYPLAARLKSSTTITYYRVGWKVL